MASPALSEILHATEEKWLNVLYAECKKNFENIHLPSHDHTHHLRVWEYAKLLIIHLAKDGMNISAADSEEIIISAFFHDQGMSRTFAKEHGAVSAIMCKKFCSASGISFPGGMNNVLEAIENHDNKDYTAVTETKGFNLQKILNIADDLDALGTLGAYRYLEIYLLRGTDLNLLPETIRKNIDSRFNNLSGYLGPESELVKAQEARYRTTCSYFDQLVTSIKDSSLPLKGPACVITHIKEKIILERRSLKETCNTIIQGKEDPYCVDFFQRILSDLDTKII